MNEKRHKVTCQKCHKTWLATAAETEAHVQACTGKAKTKEQLHTCPLCHRGNFTLSGLKTHTCRPVKREAKMITCDKVYLHRTADLTLHPMLARVLMMHEVSEKLGKQKVKKPEHRAALTELDADMQAFFADLDENGIIEPLKVTRDGKVADGRHRLRWATLRGVASVPAVTVSDEEAVRIIEGSVVARRHWTKGMKAYFAVLMHPSVVDAGKAKSAANLKQAPIPTESESVPMTREALAAKFGVSSDLIDQACKLFTSFEASKTLREKHEKLVWAGFGLGGIIAGLAGHDATHEKAIQPSNLTAGIFRRFNAFGGNIAKTWDKLPDDDQRQFVGEALGTFLSKLPEELRTIARAKLADHPDA